MLKSVDFKTSGYFPASIIFIGGLFVFVGVLFFEKNIALTLGSVSVATIIFTTHYRIRIDPNNRTYHDYLWLVGFKIGEKRKFSSLEYLFIKKNKIRQTMYLRVVSSVITKDVYDGYLKFSPDDKIHLFTCNTKERLQSRLGVLATSLNVAVVDYAKE